MFKIDECVEVYLRQSRDLDLWGKSRDYLVEGKFLNGFFQVMKMFSSKCCAIFVIGGTLTQWLQLIDVILDAVY